jgi:uncharacterized membrane protein YcaP (DUF421 family)
VLDLFQLTVHPAELFVRGTFMYLGLVLIFRFVLRRDVGAMGMADVLFVVLIADAAQNAMAGEYISIADGVILVGTLVLWNVALDWLAYHNSVVRRLIDPPPLPLIRNGRWLRRNLRSQWITADEVLSKLREQGVDDVKDVRSATLEPNGELGILRMEAKAVDPAEFG